MLKTFTIIIGLMNESLADLSSRSLKLILFVLAPADD
jgi:hypothetical protein